MKSSRREDKLKRELLCEAQCIPITKELWITRQLLRQRHERATALAESSGGSYYLWDAVWTAQQRVKEHDAKIDAHQEMKAREKLLGLESCSTDNSNG